jgi:hypothetical protein
VDFISRSIAVKTWSLVVGLCLLAVVGAIGIGRAAEAVTPQAVIAEVGELGENIYDFAKDQEWDKAAAKLTALKNESASLNAQLKQAVEAKSELAKRIAALEKFLPVKDRQATMQEANQVTLIAADLTEPFHPQTPVDVTRLDFYGRELEIWTAAKDDARLNASADALQKTWKRVRPAVVAHGGKSEAKKFDGLVGKLKGAKSPEDFKNIATPILDEVDNLEKVFAK